MRFGVCTKLEHLPLVKAAGYDYMEWQLCKLAELSQQEFEEACAAFRGANITPEAFCVFFPKEFSLVGEDVDLEKIEAYAEKALSRAAQMGGEVVVLGNGRLRRIPEGFPREKGVEQFKKVLTLCGDIAARHGIRIALEPLNTGETNLINTVAEGLAFCKELNHSQVGLVADFFHMYKSGETMEALESAGQWLVHAHIARPDPSRLAPRPEDFDTCVRWAAALKKCGYRGRLSLEIGKAPDFQAELRHMMAMAHIF